MANARESGGTSKKKKVQAATTLTTSPRSYEEAVRAARKQKEIDEGGYSQSAHDAAVARKSTSSSAFRKSKQKEIDEGGYSQSAHDAAATKKKGSVETTTSTGEKKQRRRKLPSLGEGKDFQKGEAVGGKKAGGDDGLGAARESYSAVTGRSLDDDSSASRKSTLSSAFRKSKQKEIDEGGYSQSAHDAAVAKKKKVQAATTLRTSPRSYEEAVRAARKPTKRIKEIGSSVDYSLKMNKRITADRSGVQSTIKRTNPYTKETAKVEQQKAARQGAKQAKKYASYATQSLQKGFAQSKKKGRR